MFFNRLTALVLLLFLTVFGAFMPANAKWMSKKAKQQEQEVVQKVQTFQPPPENAMQMYCEPYRKEAADLGAKNAVVRTLYKPRQLWLMNQYHKCTDDLMTQEHQYLKHVDIELAPSLPKMKPTVEPINKPESKSGPGNGGF
jgi:hypothetical protein